MKLKSLTLSLSLLVLAGTAQAAQTDWLGERAVGSVRESSETSALPAPGMPPLSRSRAWVKESLIRSGKQVQEAMRHASVPPRSLF